MGGGGNGITGDSTVILQPSSQDRVPPCASKHTCMHIPRFELIYTLNDNPCNEDLKIRVAHTCAYTRICTVLERQRRIEMSYSAATLAVFLLQGITGRGMEEIRIWLDESPYMC